MYDQPEWLVQLQIVLRLVTSVCAFIGIGVGYHDWRYWKNIPKPERTVYYNSYVPMFVLICISVLFHTPVTFAHLISNWPIPPFFEGIFRSLSLFVLGVYFFMAMVLRLRAFSVPKNVAIRKAVAIFAGMVLLTVVGFLGHDGL